MSGEVSSANVRIFLKENFESQSLKLERVKKIDDERGFFKQIYSLLHPK